MIKKKKKNRFKVPRKSQEKIKLEIRRNTSGLDSFHPCQLEAVNYLFRSSQLQVP